MGQNNPPIPTGQLPPAVMELLQQGNKLGAVKLYHQMTGIDLRESKRFVEAFESGDYYVQNNAHLVKTQASHETISNESSALGNQTSAGQHAITETEQQLPPAVMDLLQQGQKLQAIKVYQDLAGVSLKEAKRFVEAFERGDYYIQTNATVAKKGASTPKQDKPYQEPEIKSGNNGKWLLLGLVVVLAIAGYVLHYLGLC